MAGGQERILRERIRSDPGDEEDHARHGADRRVADREGPAARARGRAVLRADHRGRPATSPPRGAQQRLAAARRPRRDPDDVLRRDHRRPRPVRRLQRRRPARRRGRGQGRRARRQATTSSSRSVARPRATSGSAATRSDRRSPASPTTRPTTTPSASAQHVVELYAWRRGRPGRARLHPLRLGRQPGGRAAAAGAAAPRDDRPAATARPRLRREGAGRRLRVRARPDRRSSTRCCRATSRPASTPPCSTPRRPSTPSASGR